ncbi:MAG: Serine/threonine-protein kinase StkP [Chloroflexi bacterium]|nr:Serine/threonine-protein kinase StkP [Chloroflexota bacterium]
MALEKIGRYQIKKKLGQGGMATVFHAFDPRFERDVAVKVLPRAFLHDNLFQARFEREAKTVAALEHGAIVPVYDFGEEDGQPYIVMRLMSGGSLEDKLKKGALSIPEAVKILDQLGSGLDAAHSHGVIHRDMKPANILFDQYGNAYLSDFGIARLTESSHTLTGENILGTPAYMSPEQVQGDKDLDGRCDQYALGIIFYQMLIGHVPYQATTPAKVMMMHILEPVPDISAVSSEIPQMVEVWFTKVLSKEPEDRFETVTEMVEALKHATQGQSHPTLAATLAKIDRIPEKTTALRQQPSPPAEAKTKRGKKPLLIGAIGVVGIAVLSLLLLGYFGWQGQGPLAMLQPAFPTSSVPTSPVAPSLESTATEVAAVAPDSSPSPTPTKFSPTETQASTSTSPTPSSDNEETPTPTATNAAPEVITQGGAAQVAFINANDIWLINLDGSDLEQLTTDGVTKHDLNWHPNGKDLYFISGRCIWTVNVEMETKQVEYVICLETAKSLDEFSISPDGKQVAISLNMELYLVPFDKDRLKQARYSTHLEDMSDCEAFDPWAITEGEPEQVKDVHWSDDGNILTVMFVGNVGGIKGDAVRVLDIEDCNQQPDRLDVFPAGRLEVDNYSDSPTLENFAYDGGFLYAFTNFVRNDGYGDLYIYNGDLRIGDEKVNPINEKCCYRDPVFSPDGRYLLFTYQSMDTGGNAQLYYILYATMGTGASYEPLPVPDDFFSDPRVKPEPALRPVGGE